MIFSKITNEYQRDNIAIRDIIYKVLGIIICYIKFTTTDVSVVNSLGVDKNSRKIKGFEI